MEYLNLNKSKLYHLVELYSPFQLPPICAVDYMQTHRCCGCGIRCNTDAGQIKAFLSIFIGRAMRSIECEEQSYDKVIYPEAELLILYGLLQEGTPGHA